MEGIEKKRALRDYKGKSIICLPDEYVVIDIETTGLDVQYCDIIEIAAINIKNSFVINSFNSLVKPDCFCGIDDYITELTGITDEMLYNAPSLYEVIPQFNNFIGSNILLGHNISFDINFLYDAFVDVLDIPLNNDFIDTMRFSRKLFRDSKHHRLCDTAMICGVEYIGAHRALNDCNITFSCFDKMRSLILNNYSSFADFQELFNSGRKKIDCSAITATVEEFDEEHPFCNKTVVFTGALSGATRKEAMQKIVNVGGLISDNITKSTNFLVIGSFDFIKSVKGDKSSKMVKAEKMHLDGYDITVISEDTFVEMLENK